MKKFVFVLFVIPSLVFAGDQIINDKDADPQFDLVNYQSGSRSSSGARSSSGSRSSSGNKTYGNPQPAPKETFESKFWNYLLSGKPAYRNWAPFPGQPAGMYEGQSPHGAYLKMYVNRVAAGNPENPPSGSIIIKENYGKDKKTLMAVTVMYRKTGYDPDHHDWYWVKYQANGLVARTPPEKGSKPISGRFKSCIDCHADAEGGDYLFANDKK